MKIIKLSTSPWKLTQKEFNYYTPLGDGVVGDYRFEVNNSCADCDFWIVRGNIPSLQEVVRCRAGNLIFLEDEIYEEKKFSSRFLSQFDAVIGPRHELHRQYIVNYEMFPWLFDQKSFASLKEPIAEELKTRNICIMSSDATWIQGHKARFAFTNRLIGHFKDRIDVYGRGFTPFDCKYEILKNYKYCVAIENTVFPGYFTEKINECFLSEAMPLYHGCPDIDQYYHPGALVRLNSDNYKESIRQIEQVLEEDIFAKRIEIIREMKLKYLNEFHFPVRIAALLETHFSVSPAKVKSRVLSESFFYDTGKQYLVNGAKMMLASCFARTYMTLINNKK